jgi:hypothetical protein
VRVGVAAAAVLRPPAEMEVGGGVESSFME